MAVIVAPEFLNAFRREVRAPWQSRTARRSAGILQWWRTGKRTRPHWRPRLRPSCSRRRTSNEIPLEVGVAARAAGRARNVCVLRPAVINAPQAAW